MAVYCNLPDAELFINNKSLGSMSFSNHTAEWDVPFIQGRNLIEVSGLLYGNKVQDVFEVQLFYMTEPNILNE
ncbi:MAG: DUF4982 domain-containing protein [Mariniphaga sp.]